MNGVRLTRNSKDETFFLTQLLGARAYRHSRKLGKLGDLVAVDQGKLAEVTHFQIARPFGEPPLLIPLERVRSFSPREVVLDIEAPESYVRPLASEEVLLRDYLLDKKVLDMDEREVEVVYDMRLVFTGDRMYVVSAAMACCAGLD